MSPKHRWGSDDGRGPAQNVERELSIVMQNSFRHHMLVCSYVELPPAPAAGFPSFSGRLSDSKLVSGHFRSLLPNTAGFQHIVGYALEVTGQESLMYEV